jgi:hypothetical protein
MSKTERTLHEPAPEIVDTVRGVAARVGASVTIDRMGSIPAQFCTFKAGALARRSAAMDLNKCDFVPMTTSQVPARYMAPRGTLLLSARSARLADEAANFHNDISEV